MIIILNIKNFKID